MDDLTRLLTLCTLNLSNIVQETNGSLRAKAGGWLQSLRHASRSNTMEGSRRNINEHYDLGNIMYEQFLDETMTYSAAKFDTPEDTLQQAQVRASEALACHPHCVPDLVPVARCSLLVPARSAQ